MMNNPMYEGWKQDFLTPGSSKTMSAVKTINAALNDEQFMADHADDRTWQVAAQYMAVRQQVIDYVKASGKPMSDDANAQVMLEWDAFRQQMNNADIGWGSIANRFLQADDEPKDFGTSFLEVSSASTATN